MTTVILLPVCVRSCMQEVDELALLQQQHELYAAQVEAFREELERSLPAAAAKG